MKLLYFIIRLIEINYRYRKPEKPKQTFNYTTKNNYYIKLSSKGNQAKKA